MYVTAHRVRSPGGREGVNAFCYMHGPYSVADPEDIPESNPGILRVQMVTIPPPGNRVRSFLDIVAPDQTTWSEIRQAFMSLVSDKQSEPFPWRGRYGACYLKIGMDAETARQWRNEMALLFRAAQVVRLQA